MKGEMEIWTLAIDSVRRDSAAVLLVVAESTGSSPGRAGFKMVVAANGLAGSVGGGVMEVGLVDQAREMLLSGDAGAPAAATLVHRPGVPNASGMICSGSQTVIVCRLGPEDLPTVETILRGESGALRIDQRGLMVSDDPCPGRFRFGWTAGDGFVYEETLRRRPRLFIIGGGHCALALSELASKLDFHITLLDDRNDLNTVEKNRFADEKLIIGSYEDIARFVPEGDDVFVVVMTLGYRFDEIVIRRLFGREFRYFGVLGSRAKMKTLLNSLKREGFDSRYLKSIRTPIGLRINSRTPEEIAVSIAAEIISVRNAGAPD
jgi:xanthine dehydrogenase accessory factor